jgi:hypothetical protein
MSKGENVEDESQSQNSSSIKQSSKLNKSCTNDNVSPLSIEANAKQNNSAQPGNTTNTSLSLKPRLILVNGKP